MFCANAVPGKVNADIATKDFDELVFIRAFYRGSSRYWKSDGEFPYARPRLTHAIERFPVLGQCRTAPKTAEIPPICEKSA